MADLDTICSKRSFHAHWCSGAYGPWRALMPNATNARFKPRTDLRHAVGIAGSTKDYLPTGKPTIKNGHHVVP